MKYEDILNATQQKTQFVFFGQTQCGVCKKNEIVLKKTLKDHNIKPILVDVTDFLTNTEQTKIVKKYNLRSVPTLIITVNGIVMHNTTDELSTLKVNNLVAQYAVLHKQTA